MDRYCLDSNVFIQAKNGPYGFDFAPVFWDWLDSQAKLGVIFSSIEVYKELMDGKDELSTWAMARRKLLFQEPGLPAQKEFSKIADYVKDHYEIVRAAAFLQKADPWVIAQAKAESAIVVTHEEIVSNESKKIKIPNICIRFHVRYINCYQMLRTLNARFS